MDRNVGVLKLSNILYSFKECALLFSALVYSFAVLFYALCALILIHSFIHSAMLTKYLGATC